MVTKNGLPDWQEEPYLTIARARGILAVSKPTWTKLVREGKIPLDEFEGIKRVRTREFLEKFKPVEGGGDERHDA